MIFFLHGADTYRSRKKLHELIEEYRKKNKGDFAIHRVDAEDCDQLAFAGVLDTCPLFGGKKLIVIEHLVSSRSTAVTLIEKECPRLSTDALFFLILWERALNAEGARFRNKIQPFIAKEQEFKTLSGGSLQKWVVEEAGKRAITLGESEMAYFLSLGGDSWRIVNEMEKMALARSDCGKKEQAQDRADIFQLGDVFFTAKRDAARIFHNLIARGSDDFGIFSYLANHARTLLLIKTCAKMRAPVPPHFGIHPYVIKKSSLLARGLSQEQVSESLKKFYEADVCIKKGITTPKEAILSMLARG